MNKIEASRQLKACPFCGNKVYIFTAPNGFYGVECDKLGCITMQATYERSLEKLVRDWNGRVPRSRAKAIDEFAERIKEKLKDMKFAEFQGIDVCPCAKTGEECPYINQDVGCQYCAREQTIKEIDEIAEQLKGGAE